jgi:hypothetical protein
MIVEQGNFEHYKNRFGTADYIERLGAFQHPDTLTKQVFSPFVVTGKIDCMEMKDLVNSR